MVRVAARLVAFVRGTHEQQDDCRDDEEDVLRIAVNDE